MLWPMGQETGGERNNENGSDEVFAKGMLLLDPEGEVKRQIY